MKPYVRKPCKVGNEWQIVIAESRSPLAEKLAEVRCINKHQARRMYREIMKDVGLWI